MKMLLICMLTVCVACGSARGEERIRPVPAEDLAAILAKAPKPPAEATDLGLEMRLIDYIDCTSLDDPHDFMDQGTSRIVDGPAGKYRVTPGHEHAFFAYGYKTQGKDKPVLIVVEYPDDARRRFSLMTHDSMRPAKAHVSFSQEGGVYTGGAFPNTQRMQYFTMLNWPQDNWSPLLAVNFGRQGSQAAASRVWVYAVDQITPIAVNAPDPANERVLDTFFCLGFLAKRDNFGWKSPKSIEHMVDWCKMTGINRVTMMLYANQGWGAMVTVPSWDVADDQGNLDDILTQMDAGGGVGLICGIVADGMYGDVKHGDKPVRNLDPAEQKRVFLKGFDEMIDKYGKYKSFKGFALGSLETIGFYDTLHAAGLEHDVVAHIKQRRPDLEVLTYLGNSHLQRAYFAPYTATAHSGREYGTPTPLDMILGWENSGKPWDHHLADQILTNMKAWGEDPAEMNAVPGLAVYEKETPDDHRIADAYSNEPRGAMYHDIAFSQYKSDLLDTPYCAIFSYFDEGWLGLSKDYNFWYSKWWTGPDFNAAGALALAPWSINMARRDRLAITAGSWTVKYFGMEAQMRRFAKAYRALPPEPMTDVAKTPDFVCARWLVKRDKRYVSVVSKIPFSSKISVDGKALDLSPYELVTLVDDGAGAPSVTGNAPAEYVTWVSGRINEFRDLIEEIRGLDATAAPQVYSDVVVQARTSLGAGNPYTADRQLAYGLHEELRLRRDHLAPEKLVAARVDAAPALKGDLDAWPGGAADVRIGGDHLQGHTYFPNSWQGPDDLSARLRVAHDGTTLYVGIGVKDSKHMPKDDCQIWLSTSAYRDWKADEAKPDIKWTFAIPEGTGSGQKGFKWQTTPVDGGYVVEGSVPLANLELASGGKIGMMLTVTDLDGEPSVDLRKSWAKKQSMHWPYHPNWAVWSDARNCGELVIE